MNPRDEARDLIKNPLPPDTPVEADMNLPTTIHTYDSLIEKLEAELADARERRNGLMSRALKLGFHRDANYQIVKQEKYGDRVVDPEALRRKYPTKFIEYVRMRIELLKAGSAVKLSSDIDNADKKINLALADKVFGKNEVNGCCSRSVFVTYVVERVLGELDKP